MAQHQQSGAASSQELYGELESINELLESVDDDIAAILAEIAEEEAQSGHIPVLDDIVDSKPLSGGALETLDVRLQETTAEPANEDHSVSDSRAARAVISAVYREEQPWQHADDLSAKAHSAVTFSRDDFGDLADDSLASDLAAPSVQPQDAPRAADPLDAWLDGRHPTPAREPAREPVEDRQPTPTVDPDVLAECTAEVVSGIVEEWLPVLREELSRRLGEAVAKAVASTTARH